MNKDALIHAVQKKLNDNNIRKQVPTPTRTVHISDDEGNTTELKFNYDDSSSNYTLADIQSIADAILLCIEDSIERGESVDIRGFGSLGLNYRKPRKTRDISTGEEIDVAGRYVPKFNYGNDLRNAAKRYELSISEKPYEHEVTYDVTDLKRGN